jgi:hypothetical protein
LLVVFVLAFVLAVLDAPALDVPTLVVLAGITHPLFIKLIHCERGRQLTSRPEKLPDCVLSC